MTNIYKVELCIIDHDDISSEEIKTVLEETKYPNWCISPDVITVERKDIGEWDDSNPLNSTHTQKQELRQLFSPWLPITTAPKDGTHVLFFYGLRNAVFTAWYEDRKWWLVSPTDEDSCLFFEYEPTNCYWQPLMELPV